ncbi:glucose-6-phosphate isomerase, cytosolic-like [Prunus dulcis]|uniref:glucose-6-phosphate isomerase, cytosolic-like n=1 Tax=Prunus dulcis TaxID=3755 RepID=UPI001482A6E7|nr:glucose-6-phosphate isomerase, cytosolic-like [Prunus dulcis]
MLQGMQLYTLMGKMWSQIWEVLDKIQKFSESIRSGFWVGATGKALKDVIAVGISGSFLGPLQTDAEELFNEHKDQFSPI